MGSDRTHKAGGEVSRNPHEPVDVSLSPFAAIVQARCPRCRQGAIFPSFMKMSEHCPVCGLKFERGPGYFTGAMYFSYGMGIPMIALMTLIVWRFLPNLPLYQLVVIAWVGFLPLVPLVWRYSRVLFLHFDRYFDPED